MRTELKCLPNQSHSVAVRMKQNNVHRNLFANFKEPCKFCFFLYVINLECLSTCKHFCGGFYVLGYFFDIVQIEGRHCKELIFTQTVG